MKRALISVSDKAGVTDLAACLQAMGWEILSTGGTARLLREADIAVKDVSELTGFPECFDGRVKTLHPKVHGGILNRRSNEKDRAQKAELGIEDIDLVCVNLYPFAQTVARGAELPECIENIDIGGPSMIRSAAKNYKDVIVLTDPADYEPICELLLNGEMDEQARLNLALKAFETTARYDAMIADYLKKQAGADYLGDTLTVTFEKVQDLRYGENPHQSAAFYKTPGMHPGTLTAGEQLQGKELSFNNINDTNGALAVLKEYTDEPTIVAVKHANPCAVASADTIAEAFEKANAADPTSIFGGIIASNGTVDADAARQMAEIFLEVVVAPDFTDEALEIFKQKPNLRVIRLPEILTREPGWDIRSVDGGLLVQQTDDALIDNLTVVTERAPSEKEMQDLMFAWRAVKNTKSNAISLAKDKVLIANGPGQVNRVWPTQECMRHAGEAANGAVMASDAFFPFDDCVKAAAEAGITAIIQPGGSVRDQDSIDAANAAGIAMVFTGMRHFKH